MVKLRKPRKSVVINVFDNITVKKPLKLKQNKNITRYVASTFDRLFCCLRWKLKVA